MDSLHVGIHYRIQVLRLMFTKLRWTIVISKEFRTIEDYVVIYFGSAMFKLGRLLLIASFSVHLFACIFFRVKESSAASQDDVAAFYASKGVSTDVRDLPCL